MILRVEQRKIFLEVLEEMFGQLEDFKTFLKDSVNKRLDEITTGNLATARAEVIDRADEQEWIIPLYEAVYAAAGPVRQARLDEIGTIEEIREGRFHDAAYVNGYPLVNRTTLRGTLRKLAEANGPRILNVKGSRYSGKSHAMIHIRHVAASLGIPVAEIELRKWATGEEIRPYDLGTTILYEVPSLELPKNLDPKASRWSMNFLNWIVPQLDSQQKRVWVVFDDFETEKLHYPLPDALHDFIQLLAEKAAKSHSIRLFLINYDKPLSNQIKPALVVDTAPTITEKELGDFFLAFYDEQMPPTDLPTAEADAVQRAQRVWTRMQADAQETRLETMRDAVKEECDKMLQPGGGV